MNYDQLVAFADHLTSVCPVDKDGKTTLDVLRHTIMEHPHFFPKSDPRIEHLAEETEFVTMHLDAAGVPKEEGGNGLSLWGRVQRFASGANSMTTNDDHEQNATAKAEAALADAAELLAEIMRDEVNHQDEAEKWLREYAPQHLFPENA